MYWVIEVLIGTATYLSGAPTKSRITFLVASCVGVRQGKMSLQRLVFFGGLMTDGVVQSIIWQLWVHSNPNILTIKMNICYASLNKVLKFLNCKAILAHI